MYKREERILINHPHGSNGSTFDYEDGGDTRAIR